MGVADITPNHASREAVDFVTSFWEDGATFILRLPRENKLLVFAYPFHVRAATCLRLPRKQNGPENSIS